MTTLTERLPDLGVLLDYLPAQERALVEDAYLRTVATAPRHRAESLPPMVRSHDPEAAAAAVARGLARELRTRRELVESSWSTREVAQLLGVSSEAVRKRRTKGGLVAFQHRSDWRYPRWQFSGSTIVEGVPVVWAALPDRHDVFGLVRWFTLPSAQLEGRTPLEAVLAGDVARAADAASYLGSR